MAKRTMRRQASDNVYMHKDFHGALSAGIDYLDRAYGQEAVREYLSRFAKSYYAPLIEDIKTRGLIALKERFENIYSQEGGAIHANLCDDELTLEVDACPALTHMRERGYTVARLFVETERAVNAALCEETPFAYELLEYDPETGRGVQRFSRRPQ